MASESSVVETFDFNNLSESTHRRILEYRNHPVVRKSMVNQHVISIKEHNDFLRKLRKDDGKKYWLLRKSGLDVGVTYCSWGGSLEIVEIGLYANLIQYSKGAGSILMDQLLAFCSGGGFKTVIACALPDNQRAIHLYANNGFVRKGSRVINGVSCVTMERST